MPPAIVPGLTHPRRIGPTVRPRKPTGADSLPAELAYDAGGPARQPTVPGGGRSPDHPPGSPDTDTSAPSDAGRGEAIGQVVHDLFAVSLALHAALPYTTEPGRARVVGAITDLGAVIRSVRQLSPPTGLGPVTA
jgi:hypothetical protein